MATRINVTAVRDCPAAEVQAVFAEVLKPPCGTDCVRVETREHNGWVWFMTSVWGVSADKNGRRAQEGRLPRLRNRGDLMALLTIITAHKAASQIDYHHRAKRGAGQVQSESAAPIGPGWCGRKRDRAV